MLGKPDKTSEGWYSRFLRFLEGFEYSCTL